MDKLTLNEFAALALVLNNLSVRDLIQGAMNTFAESESIKAQDNANICSQAIATFLM